MTIAAPAKINLWLRVGPPDGTGYHELSTLFCALELADTVVLRTAVPADGEELETSFASPLTALPDLGTARANLAVRAARAFVERAGAPDLPVPQIRLVKRVPAGGGLGGGSSDAGAVLRGLSRLYPRRLDPPAVQELAAGIGSDVPFFVLGVPLARGAGRGELLTPLPALAPRPVVLVLPPFPIKTGDAYAWLDEARKTGAPGRHAPRASNDMPPSLTWQDVTATASNDFEGPVFERHRDLREVRDALRSLGAVPALLAGSGSTVFGVFSDGPSAEAAVRALRERFTGHRVLLTGTRTR